MLRRGFSGQDKETSHVRSFVGEALMEGIVIQALEQRPECSWEEKGQGLGQ